MQIQKRQIQCNYAGYLLAVDWCVFYCWCVKIIKGLICSHMPNPPITTNTCTWWRHDMQNAFQVTCYRYFTREPIWQRLALPKDQLCGILIFSWLLAQQNGEQTVDMPISSVANVLTWHHFKESNDNLETYTWHIYNMQLQKCFEAGQFIMFWTQYENTIFSFNLFSCLKSPFYRILWYYPFG